MLQRCAATRQTRTAQQHESELTDANDMRPVPTNAPIRSINSTNAISTTTYERRKLLAVFPWSSYEEQQKV